MRYTFSKIHALGKPLWTVVPASNTDPFGTRRVINGINFTLSELSDFHVDAVLHNQPDELIQWITDAIDKRQSALVEDRYFFRWYRGLEYRRAQDHERGVPYMPISAEGFTEKKLRELILIAENQKEGFLELDYLKRALQRREAMIKTNEVFR